MESFIRELFKGHIYETIAALNVYSRILIALVVMVIGWLFGLQIRKLFNTRLRKRFNDPLLAVFLSNIFRGLIVIIALLLALKIMGLGGIATSVLAGAGISAFIIGFALKDIGENFLAGILLAFKRPFRVGDMIECNSVKGRVMALNLRDTELRTVDGKDVFMPNSMLIKNPFMNFTLEGKLRHEFTIRIHYGGDYVKARSLVLDVISDHIGVLHDDFKPMVHITELAADGIVMTAYFWLASDGAISPTLVKTDFMLRIMQQLELEGYKLGGVV